MGSTNAQVPSEAWALVGGLGASLLSRRIHPPPSEGP